MNEDYKIMQDFHNKRANAHASLFVASMFGLFTLLSLMGRIFDRASPNYVPPNASLNYAVIFALLVISYGLIFLFGLYSLLNFFFYATVSQDAENKIVQGKERELVEAVRNDWAWILRVFSIRLKVPLEPLTKETRGKSFSHNKETFFVIMYFAVGLLPLIAFMIWLFV